MVCGSSREESWDGYYGESGEHYRTHESRGSGGEILAVW